MLKHTSDTEISDLDLPTLCHEYVLSLQISVKNLPVVDVLYGKGHLDEPIQNLVLMVTNYRQAKQRRFD